eukprot:TRINITY_DN5144_c0_g1_i2.p1 TRINITY_DN5144_c0_g1~~TRINITY_DN5144_c0_g1_i2.p1  ORF type:complete len:286 (+),score=72.15 TRINITY_DN5144_c0_g1_i2:61-918(+)
MGAKVNTQRVLEIRKLLDKGASKPSKLLSELSKIEMTKDALKETKIAKTLLKIKDSSKDEDLRGRIKDLLKAWSESTSCKPAKDMSNRPFEASSPLPKRNAKGVVVFEDHPEFKPNLSPKEVLQAGSFGGTYFRPIYSSITKMKYGSEAWEELPKDWIEGLNVKTQVASSVYDISKNKYKAKCGGSLEMWESSGWMDKQDPYGWFQWYCRFYQGRRTEDDARQIDRWSKCCGLKGRWKNNLIGKIHKAGVKFDNPAVSPVIRQVLLHWGYELTEEDYRKRAKELK